MSLKQKNFFLIINSVFLTQKNSSQNKKFEKKKKKFKIPIFDFLKKKFFSMFWVFNRILIKSSYFAYSHRCPGLLHMHWLQRGLHWHLCQLHWRSSLPGKNLQKLLSLRANLFGHKIVSSFLHLIYEILRQMYPKNPKV